MVRTTSKSTGLRVRDEIHGSCPIVDLNIDWKAKRVELKVKGPGSIFLVSHSGRGLRGRRKMLPGDLVVFTLPDEWLK